MFEDYLPEFNEILHSFECDCITCKQKWDKMDKAYKKLGKEAKKIEKDTKEVLKKDEGRDKLVKAGKKVMTAKKMMKGKC